MRSHRATRLASLLQQTRVNTFDPRIEQVYTAPAAHLVRGDWGMKRPLPSSWQPAPDMPAAQPFRGALRYVTAEALDTPQHLTAWRESERDPLFRTRWHEAGTRLSDRSKRDVLSSAIGEDEANAAQGVRPRIMYDPATLSNDTKPAHVVWGAHHARFADAPDVLPNYNAMSQREFQKFLSKVRTVRGKFRETIKAQRREASEHTLLEQLSRRRAKEGLAAAVPESEWASAKAHIAPPFVDLWTEARLAHAPQSAANFMHAHAQERRAVPHSTTISAPAHAAPAHPLQGIQYAQPDTVYTQLLAEPIQGHAVQRVEDNRRNRYFMGADAGLAVAAGGHIGHLALQHRHGLDVVDYTRAKPTCGMGHFRILHAFFDLHGAPRMTRRTPPQAQATSPDLGYIHAQLMALRRGALPPMPGTPRWIDEPRAQTQTLWNRTNAPSPLRTSTQPGSLFGALARNGRPPNTARANGKRQRFQKRKRDASTDKDVQMLDNIRNLLSPQ
ncbi:hypothetical protein MVES1_001324 [Malassezia vespertilionis]|uniref:Uncharacterized protein n=1 Tax=Malassezia vespertilionis TaxID=2020962 RepID=A0A2N1JEJ4_9BASI|nr:uncharacterized protein MVES1_001324 [Malassezia vespertilionis]PKI84971.1 hypothetical protein MVES_001243 [Malassezia vespertilionis]WFD05986.1 hypothetical protein MVES1_001324 [Malassezia vespertilionis]